MTNGTSQGLFIIVAVVIFGIFTLISYLIFQESMKPKLTSIFEQSLNTTKSFLNSYSFENMVLHNTEKAILDYKVTNDTVVYSASGENNVNSFYLPFEKFEENTNYKITFDIELLEGALGVIGGHSLLFDSTIFDEHPVENTKINGVLQKGNYHHGIIYPFVKGQVYNVEVLIKSQDKQSFVTNPIENGFFIQPNRFYGRLVDKNPDDSLRHTSEPFKVKLSNLRVEKLQEIT